MKRIILASASPRRKTLLEWAEVSFEVHAVATDERFPDGMTAGEAPIFIARQKAIAVAEKLADSVNHIIVAADTIVVLENEIIGKPADEMDAINILTSLSGKVHRVITGVVLWSAGKEIAFADITEVEFHPLTSEQITFYVKKYKPFDKAGAYAIQEWIGVTGIKRISGDFYNVMGLPVSRVVKSLQEMA